MLLLGSITDLQGIYVSACGIGYRKVFLWFLNFIFCQQLPLCLILLYTGMTQTYVPTTYQLYAHTFTLSMYISTRLVDLYLAKFLPVFNPHFPTLELRLLSLTNSLCSNRCPALLDFFRVLLPARRREYILCMHGWC